MPSNRLTLRRLRLLYTCSTCPVITFRDSTRRPLETLPLPERSSWASQATPRATAITQYAQSVVDSMTHSGIEVDAASQHSVRGSGFGGYRVVGDDAVTRHPTPAQSTSVQGRLARRGPPSGARSACWALARWCAGSSECVHEAPPLPVPRAKTRAVTKDVTTDTVNDRRFERDACAKERDARDDRASCASRVASNADSRP